VYATFDGHHNNDENTYVYVSNDFGQTWRKITNGLPQTTVNRIAEHPRSANLLVIGDALGVHFSNDTGASWHSLSTNMPTVPVRSVVFQARDNALVAGRTPRHLGAGRRWPFGEADADRDADRRDAHVDHGGKQITVTPLGTRFGVADFMRRIRHSIRSSRITSVTRAPAARRSRSAMRRDERSVRCADPRSQG
jgi:photosystem II stability/assembly factor-like uncharacterized protein